MAVFRLAAMFTLLAVAMGSVVCATGSGAACPNWPGCRPDTISPQWAFSPVVEFTHRVVAVLSGPLVLAAALASLRVRPADRLIRVLPWVALLGAFASAVFGRLVIVSTLSAQLGAVDLFAALVCMTAMTVATVRIEAGTGVRSTDPERGARRVAGSAAATCTVLVAMHVLGILAAGTGSFTRCLGWPMWQLVDADRAAALQVARIGLAVVAIGLVVTTAALARRVDHLRGLGVVLVGLVVLEQVLGLRIHLTGLDRAVGTAYSVTAVLILWCAAFTAAVAWAHRPSMNTEDAELTAAR